MKSSAVLFIYLSGLLLSVVLAYENLALNKPTWQQYPFPGKETAWGAAKAVDGLYTDLSAGGGQCVISDAKPTAEWRVDLMAILSVHHIMIHYRTDGLSWDGNNPFTSRFLGFSVYISKTTNREDGVLCFRDTIYTRATIPNPVNISCPYHGRYVIYYNNRTHPPYPEGYSGYAHSELCEVEVQGCPISGYYRKNCSIQCPQNCQGGRCHILDGTCLGCVSGYTGQICDKPCNVQMYGVNCSQKCGVCLDNEACHHINGSCLKGCDKGYHGQKCDQECSDGYYGFNCVKTCSLTCEVPGRCDRITGSCNGRCLLGWKGNMCNHGCPRGFFGDGCLNNCSVRCKVPFECDRVTGRCFDGCQAGWGDRTCNTKVEMLYMKNPDCIICSAFYGVLVPFILSVLCNIGCAIRLIRNRDVCNHRKQRKQTEASDTKATYDPGEMYSQAEENSGYQELGELSKPALYDQLK